MKCAFHCGPEQVTCTMRSCAWLISPYDNTSFIHNSCRSWKRILKFPNIPNYISVSHFSVLKFQNKEGFLWIWYFLTFRECSFLLVSLSHLFCSRFLVNCFVSPRERPIDLLLLKLPQVIKIFTWRRLTFQGIMQNNFTVFVTELCDAGQNENWCETIFFQSFSKFSRQDSGETLRYGRFIASEQEKIILILMWDI